MEIREVHANGLYDLLREMTQTPHISAQQLASPNENAPIPMTQSGHVLDVSA